MITEKRATELRPGDILSNNGARIESAVLLQTVGSPGDDEVCLVYSFDEEHGGGQRIEYVPPDRVAGIWTAD